MAYDEGLAARVRAAVTARAECREMAMFGGLCWTVNTHMAAGVIREDLMIPVGKDGVEAALSDGAHQMRMGERTMSGMVRLTDPTDEQIDAWVGPAVDRALALEPKPPKPPKSPKG